MSPISVGMGYDIHPLVKGRRLVLGGCHIPFTKGLVGHSDADCLSHAIVDALLGATGQGDIGQRFGVRRPAYRNASSAVFLRRTMGWLRRAGWRVNNVDATIVCESPKLAAHLPKMRQRLARLLLVNGSRVNLKATTAKGIGPLGGSQAIAAMAVVLVVKAVARGSVPEAGARSKGEEKAAPSRKRLP